MPYFNTTFMNQRRAQWLRSLHAAEVQVGSSWYRGEINHKRIEGDTLLVRATFGVLDGQECTITASRLIDVRGEVAAQQSRTIKKAKGQGSMIDIKIPLYEVTP